MDARGSDDTKTLSAPNAPAVRLHEIVLWLGSVLATQTLVHTLNRWVFAMDARSATSQFVFWMCAKLMAWIAPTLVLLRRAKATSLEWLGLSTTSGLAFGALAGCVWIAIQQAGASLGLPLFSKPPPALETTALLGALVISPLFEELLFRGAMLRLMRARHVGRDVSVIASALAFAALHVPGWFFRRGLDPSIAMSFLTIGIFGLVLGYLAWRVPTLWAPIALHFANNLWSTGALDWLVAQTP